MVHAEKVGKSVIYHLKLSVLEEVLLGFVHSFGLGGGAGAQKGDCTMNKELIAGLAWGGAIFALAVGATFAQAGLH